jgi:hypothetical protein
MLKDRQLKKIAFEEKLFSVLRYALILGLIVLVYVLMFVPIGRSLDQDNGDYKKHNKSYKMEVVK